MEEGNKASSSQVIETVDRLSSPLSPETKHDGGVILIPRPSDDPSDPLVE